ncbi:hypothetical protein JCGZ_03520 [Jatropha curcas]|uniref:Uncharacterized protein n=1 Tax=Jatropha curcas TaxID=180498 RepID=A0A067JG69_JATCU|nr:hypothetical protein JCGZ_03520 [Jatropha curcas]
MMVDYEVDQDNLNIKPSKGDQTELRRAIKSKSFGPIRPSFGGIFKTNQTEFWRLLSFRLEPTKPIRLSFGRDQMIKSIQIKILRANQTELRRYLQNQSDRVLEIVTDPTGANKADQTELWM